MAKINTMETSGDFYSKHIQEIKMEDLKQLNEDINALVEEYLDSQQVDYEKIDYKDLAYNLKYNHCLNGKLEILMEELA